MPTVSVSYELERKDVASVIYAMWDSNFDFGGSVEKQEDVKENIKSAIRRHGPEYADYLCDVSVPDNGESFEDALLKADQVFREFAKREAMDSELRAMPETVRENYEKGEKVVRIPGDLTPSGNTCYFTFFPGRPDWLSNEEFNESCFLLRKNE